MKHNRSDPQALPARLKDGTLIKSTKTDISSLAQREGVPNLREIQLSDSSNAYYPWYCNASCVMNTSSFGYKLDNVCTKKYTITCNS